MLHTTFVSSTMSYWIFRTPQGTCLAVDEEALAEGGIGDDLGELIYDDPMPRLIAGLHVGMMGGGIVDPVPTPPKRPAAALQAA